MGQKVYLMTINGKILKTKDYAFIIADTKENADEYLQQLNDQIIVGGKDGYGIYLNGYSDYGIELYNKDTEDKIGFFYTLPEIIANMDLIKE